MRFLVSFTLLACASAPLPASTPASIPTHLPAWFEPAPQGGAFVSRGSEGTLLVKGSEAALRFAGSPEGSSVELKWRLVGSAAAQVEGVEPLGSKTNYLHGSDRSQWRTGVPHFAKARVNQAYPGVDVVWYANGRLLEYDFVVAPGADASKVAVRIDGAGAPSLTPSGDLLIEAQGLKIHQHKPVAYQLAGGRRLPVDASYSVAKDGSIRFNLGQYDRSKELIIDPVFSYAGFLGGTGLDMANGVAIDAEGALWITGVSQSSIWFPEDYVTVQREKKSGRDAFLARILPLEGGGGKVDYWTYIGGDGDDEATAIAMGKDGRLYITGNTSSLNFPVAGGAFKTSNEQNDVEAFVLRFDPKLEGPLALSYSSYFGGAGREYPHAIAVRDDGRVVIAGHSTSPDLPKLAATALQPANRGGTETFFAVFDMDASSADATLVKASFLGGASTDIAYGAGWDKQGRLVLAGVSMSEDFPVSGPSYQSGIAGAGDVFFVVLDLDKSGLDQLVYGTFVGGSGHDVATALQIDELGRAWVTGYTTSSNWPVTPGAYQLSRNGVTNAFLLCVDLDKFGAGFLVYSSYFGGNGAEVPYALALQPGGKATIAGYSTSRIFPAKNSPIGAPVAVRLTEAFIASFDTTKPGAEALSYAAQYGGRATDVATAIGVDALGNTAAVGYTLSDDLPTAAQTPKENGTGLASGWYLKLLADPR